MGKKKEKEKAAPEIVAPDGKLFRKSAAWVRPERLTVHIVGDPKVGKSSFVAALGEAGVDGLDPFIIPTQPGLEGLNVNCPIVDCPACKGSRNGCENCSEPPGPGRVRKIVSTYEDLKTWIDWAIQSPFNPICIDPIAPAHEACLDRVKKDFGVELITNVPGMGTGWFIARDYLQKLIGPILYAGKGLIMISHIQWRDIIIGKDVITIAESNFGKGKAGAYINQIVDVEMHFSIKAKSTENQRWIACTKPGQANLGGDRTGYLPGEFDRGTSAEEAAKKFLSFYYEM